MALLILILGFFCSCSSAERDFKDACKPGPGQRCEAEIKKQGMAAGLHEAEHLTEGLTGLWWSVAEDYFVAGLHRDNNPEPPQVGLYFGSLKDPAKRTVHWFGGEAPGGEDVLGVRVYKDESSKLRIYLLSQLQNAGYYFPAFYYFNNESLSATTIYSRINCEQIQDLEIATSGLNIRCRVPSFGDEMSSEVIEYMDAKVDQTAFKDEDAESGDVAELSMDVDPTVISLRAIRGSEHRDWLSAALRSCVTIRGASNLCYPAKP
jgi:hypothetical protein